MTIFFSQARTFLNGLERFLKYFFSEPENGPGFEPFAFDYSILEVKLGENHFQ